MTNTSSTVDNTEATKAKDTGTEETATEAPVTPDERAARLARRLSARSINVYAAADTVEEIHKRVKNLLTGRDFTVVKRYTDVSDHNMPNTETGCVLDEEGGRNGAISTWTDRDGGGIGITWKPGFGRLGIRAEFRTEQEAADAERSGSHRGFNGKEVVFVRIDGGTSPDDISRDSHISILRTNENGVSEQIVLAPRRVDIDDKAKIEGAFLDRVAAHIRATGEPLTLEAVEALAVKVRDEWETGLLP